MNYKLLLLPLLTLIFNACTDKVQTETVDRSDYKFVPLAEVKYAPAEIAAGTELKILANLGGPKNNKDTVFYYLFIALNKNNGDTLLILCPEITVDVEAGIEAKTSTTPLAFDMSKKVTTGFFEPLDSSKSLLLNGPNMEKLVNTNNSQTDSQIVTHLLDPSNAIKVVVLDKEDPTNKVFRFKAAVGALNFQKIPWHTN
jgi:hypothetical protein